jgi:uncharacterized membrane protein
LVPVTVVGGGTNVNGEEAFLHRLGQMTPLGDLPGGSFFSTAYDTAADGGTVVGVSAGGSGVEPFRWKAGVGMQGLGTPPGGGIPLHMAVSADGAVVVGGNGSTDNAAFIWDAVNGMRRLSDVLVAEGVNLTGWRLRAATGISANGRVIVGYGYNGNAARNEGWIVDLDAPAVPEPVSLAMGVVALCGAAFLCRKYR